MEGHSLETKKISHSTFYLRVVTLKSIVVKIFSTVRPPLEVVMSKK